MNIVIEFSISLLLTLTSYIFMNVFKRLSERSKRYTKIKNFKILSAICTFLIGFFSMTTFMALLKLFDIAMKS